MNIGLKKINVLELNVSSKLGGGQEHMYSLIKGMDKNKFRIFSVSQNDGPFYKKFKEESSSIYDLNLRKISVMNILKLINIVIKNKIDIIHSHGKGAGLYSRLVGFFTGRKVIHTLHGIHYEKYPKIFQRLYFLIERLFSHFTFKIINVSESEKRLALSLGMYNSDKAIIIPNGVDKNKFDIKPDIKKYETEFNSYNKKVFLTVARYSYEKGLDILIKAVNEVVKKRKNVLFLLVGEGQERKKLQDMINQYSLQKNILLTGSREDIPELLKFSDCFILPSRWEGLPITLIEAMAAKKIIIASKVVGNIDIIKDKKNGLLFEKDNYADLANKINYVLDNDCSRFSKEAYDDFLQDFPLEKMVKKTEILYEEAIRK